MEMTKEELCMLIGQLRNRREKLNNDTSIPEDDPEYPVGVDNEERDLAGRLDDLIAEARDTGLLVADNSRGNGWRLLDMDGVSLMPTKEDVFAEKGHGWVYWLALGRPYSARLYSISDPLEEQNALTANGPIIMDDDDDDPNGGRRFEVVEGRAGE